jgi:hypothetical protein
VIALALVSGCARSKSPGIAIPGLSRSATNQPEFIAELDATADPPLGWRVQRADQNNRYAQRVWVSPTGDTSYGVILFALPFPVGDDLALLGFLSEMKRSEGDARLITKQRNPQRNNRLEFIAEGGRYHVDGIIATRGRRGWAIYAGTLRGGRVALDELELAVQSRENTTLGAGH